MSALLTPSRTITLPSDQDASGRTLGEEEIALVTEVLRSGTLTCTKGKYTKEFEKQFAKLYQVPFAHASSSGSAAIHCAISAINPEPGDEIITTSITDMGALTPILYQGAIPVFADVDPKTGNLTAETVESRISHRTKAIVVTHLFGNPCEMSSIMKLAFKKGIPVIEDCAQAFLARHDGQYVGTFGSIGCFSLQQGKHITTGEGGVCISFDSTLARHIYLYANKAWGYGDANPDHYFIALNYRMSELQGAVALGQLPKLEEVVARRSHLAEALTDLLSDIPGVQTPVTGPKDIPVYWKYPLLIDPKVIQGGAVGLSKALKDKNIASAPRYIQKPAFRCEVFAKQRTFGNSRWPFTLARPEATNYDATHFPGTFEYLDRVLVLPWNEKYTEEHLDYLATSIREAAEQLQNGGAY
jgi:perosamine synthetase